MSIIITNISEQKGKEYGKGKQYYMLRINDKELVEFEHQFSDGLAECLRKAADAMDEIEKEGLFTIHDQKMIDALFSYKAD